MSICPYCQSGPSDLPASGGRCPVCGNPLAWEPPELSASDPYAGLGLGEIQPPANMTMQRQGGIQHFAPQAHQPAEDPVATLKNTLARIVMRAADCPATHRRPLCSRPPCRRRCRRFLHCWPPTGAGPAAACCQKSDSAAIVSHSARQRGTHRNWTLPLRRTNQRILRDGMATLESGIGLTTPGDGAATAAWRWHARPAGGRKRPSTFDERAWRRRWIRVISRRAKPTAWPTMARHFLADDNARTSLTGAGGVTAMTRGS